MLCVDDILVSEYNVISTSYSEVFEPTEGMFGVRTVHAFP